MKIFPLACAFDNYGYLIVCEESGVAAVVDPTEAYPVWTKCEELSVQLKKVFCTHHHHDHIGGIADLLDEQTDLEVHGYSGDSSRIAGMNRPLKDGDEVVIGKNIGRVLHTPGHTSGSLCYLFEKGLFTGDTLFGAGCGRLFEGTPTEMYTSLSTVASLPDETSLWFGHEYTEFNLKFALSVESGNPAITERAGKVAGLRQLDFPTTPSTLGEEKQTNPFLRCDSDEILRKLGYASKTDPVKVFTQLREMRNGFQG